MRFLYGAFALVIFTAFILYAKAHGMIVSDDVVLLCMAIAFASGIAGGD